MQRRQRGALYLSGFFFSLHYALPAYINSSFLATLIDEKLVGVIYTIASLFTIVAFFGVASTLRKAGDYRVTLELVFLDLIALLALSTATHPTVGLVAMVIHLLAIPLIYFNMDILLEHYSTKEETGGIRGVYLTVANVGWVAAPLLASMLLRDSNYYPVIYGASFMFLLLTLLIFRSVFKGFKDPEYKEIVIITTIKNIVTNRNTRHIFWCGFFLQFFFAWMIVYMPIYMHNHVGMGWNAIGLILAIALLPYLFLEGLLGRLADTRWGEKEILTLGFAITGITTIIISFISTADFLVWAIILFATRIGAAMIEVMTETYFFKITDERDIDVLSFFRTVRPLAYIIGPLLATIILLFSSYTTLFIILGLLMIYAMRHSLAIKDTR